MKHVIALFCILFSFCAHAQFTKGDKFIGGNVTMKHVSYDDGDEEDVYFGVSPSAGIFLTKNFALGLDLGYSHDSYKTYVDFQVSSKRISQSYTTGIFAKRFFTISDKFFFALKGDVVYQRSINNHTSVNGVKSSTKSYVLGTNLTPSFIFFPSPKWGIEASLGSLSYTHNQEIPADGTTTDQLNFYAGTFSLGFTYYLRK
jgi:hypothetical protein